jgi:hypothetical protein
MTNDRIQKWLAWSASGRLMDVSLWHESIHIVRWMLDPDGPIGIADEAAWELIQCECECCEDAGHWWYETHPRFLMFARDEEEVAQAISRAVRYLAGRGLLMAHPQSASMVRRIDSQLERAGAEVLP